LRAYRGKVPRDLLTDVVWDSIGGTPYTFTVAPYGYCWLAL